MVLKERKQNKTKPTPAIPALGTKVNREAVQIEMLWEKKSVQDKSGDPIMRAAKPLLIMELQPPSTIGSGAP